MTLHGNSSMFGKPPVFVTVAGTAELIRDKAAFEAHWNKDLERWFAQPMDYDNRPFEGHMPTRDESIYFQGETVVSYSVARPKRRNRALH